MLLSLIRQSKHGDEAKKRWKEFVMDNDKFMDFQSATMTEFEIRQEILRILDSQNEARRRHRSMYVMLQDYGLQYDVNVGRVLSEIEIRANLAEAENDRQVKKLRERLASAERATENRWSDYIKS